MSLVVTAGYSTFRGADKPLARPGRKQAKVSVRMARISFGALPCRKRNLMTARVSMLLNSRASLKCFRACLLPGRAKDFSALQYEVPVTVGSVYIPHASQNRVGAEVVFNRNRNSQTNQ